MRQEMMGFGSSISWWLICKQSAPRSRQITTQHLITQSLQVGHSSWRPTNSVKTLKAESQVQHFGKVSMQEKGRPWRRRLDASAAASSMSSSNGSNSFAAACFFPVVPDFRLLMTAGSSGGISDGLCSSSDGGATSFADLRHKCHTALR